MKKTKTKKKLTTQEFLIKNAKETINHCYYMQNKYGKAAIKARSKDSTNDDVCFAIWETNALLAKLVKMSLEIQAKEGL